MKRTYSKQEVMLLISGMNMLVERERGLVRMVDATGKRQIRYLIRKYQKLIEKLHSEV